MIGGWKIIAGKEVQKRDEWEMGSGRAAAGAGAGAGAGAEVCRREVEPGRHKIHLRHHYRELGTQSCKKAPKIGPLVTTTLTDTFQPHPGSLFFLQFMRDEHRCSAFHRALMARSGALLVAREREGKNKGSWDAV
jgi:hypothetical protein